LNCEDDLREIFKTAEFLPVLRAIRALNLPDWWLAGGAVRNTVWRKLFPQDCELTIKDFDIAFFDGDGKREGEIAARETLQKEFPNLIFDVKNQASFGEWRPWHFSFCSSGDGIAHWLHTATAVGIRLNDADEIEIFAPYGLADLFGGVIRPTWHNADAEAAELKKLDFLKKCPALVTGEVVPEVMGNPPSLNGLVCDQFIVSEVWYDGVLETPANVSYLRFGEQWHHMCIDVATIFWSLLDKPPEALSVPEENVEIPLFDLGERYHLNGVVLERYEMAYIPDGAVVRFFFANGTCVLIKCIDDHETYEIVV